MKNVEIKMSDFVDYMEGFDEGKCDNPEPVEVNKKQTQKPKRNALSRRKKAIAKSKARLNVLKNVCDYIPSDESVRGIVKNHQMELVKPGQSFGMTRANKRRQDSVTEKIKISEREMDIA